MKLKPKIMADGTRCYKGPGCKKHGVQAQRVAAAAKAEQLQTEITALLNKPQKRVPKPLTEVPEGYIGDYPPKPEWWDDHQDQRFERNRELFQKLGVEHAYVPTFHQQAIDYGYIGIETGDKDTQLIVSPDGTYHKQGEKYYCRAWMYKHGKPVAMLRFSAYPKDYVPEEGKYPYVESTVCDIEVNKDHVGNGYGMEVIRQVEKRILGGRLIHSNGSYTPEGNKMLGGKLPYTHEAQMEHGQDLLEGKIPAPKFRSMTFVNDWENLRPNS